MDLSEYKSQVASELRTGHSVESIAEDLHLICENSYYYPPTYDEVLNFVRWVRRYERACGRL